MSSHWRDKTSDVSVRVNEGLGAAFHALGEPARAARLRQVIIVLLALWALSALARMVWVLLPQPATPAAPAGVIFNPVEGSAQGAPAYEVDIDRLRSWHLFGQQDSSDTVVQTPTDTTAAQSEREGIEKNASETRLALKLRGAVASSEDGLGHAIIEYQSKQAVYAVEDELPVPGKVTLAKVMQKQVVLDNRGTYELLTLFEESSLDSQIVAAPSPAPQRRQQAPRTLGRIDARAAGALAGAYREQLYTDPQALTDVVAISAVRNGADLVGYEIAPGKDVEQFHALGFKPGDVVTSVNGIELTDPTNTMRLYQTMRTASEAVFEIQRDSQPVTLNVSLGAGGADQ